MPELKLPLPSNPLAIMTLASQPLHHLTTRSHPPPNNSHGTPHHPDPTPSTSIRTQAQHAPTRRSPRSHLASRSTARRGREAQTRTRSGPAQRSAAAGPARGYSLACTRGYCSRSEVTSVSTHPPLPLIMMSGTHLPTVLQKVLPRRPLSQRNGVVPVVHGRQRGPQCDTRDGEAGDAGDLGDGPGGRG